MYLSNNDYCIANATDHLSNNPDSKFKGWYFGKIDSQEKCFTLEELPPMIQSKNY